MSQTRFGPLSAVALLETEIVGTDGRIRKRHAEKLERLSLFDCEQLLGSIVQRFLCEMPNLNEIQAKVMTDRDVENDDRPWVCQKFHMGLGLAIHGRHDYNGDRSRSISSGRRSKGDGGWTERGDE